MDSFLRQTAVSILQKIDWKQLSNTTLVLPSHRAGLVLKDELLRLQQASHAQAVWAPTVQTLPQFQDALSPLYAEDELFTIIRLFKLYKGTMPLDVFYGWGRQLLADFTNIDASMPASEVPNFFENTIAAHELSEWQLDKETEERLRGLVSPDNTHSSPGSVRSLYEQLWRQMYDLYQALHAEMDAEQKGYPGMRQRAVIDHWEDEALQAKLAGRTFVFVGFNYLLPVERELMIRLRDAGQALFFWDYPAVFETNEKAFSFTRLNSGILGDNGERCAENGDPKKVTLIECVSREAQAQFVHRWLQENHTAKGQKTGVVICDETMLEPVIYTLPAITLEGEDEPAPINITKGFPLRNTAIYARVLAWLNDPQRGKGDDPVQPELLDELLAAFFPVVEDASSPVTEAMSSVSWQELLVLESEYQVRKIVNQLRLVIARGIGVPFTIKLLRLLIRRMMEGVTMPFHGEPVTDIQVMGVLETRLLDFDNLLLLHVEEGVIPQRQPDISFIPFYLRKAYHMQTSDERATVYAYNFFRLLSRAGHTTMLYSAAGNTEGGKGPSRFIMQINYSPEFEVKKMSLIEQTTFHELIRDRLETKALPLPTRLSPSALNTFITCPRCFYLQYVQGLRPVEEEDVLFEPNTLGSFVHHTIEYIYRTYFLCDNSRPVRITPEAVEAVRTDEQKMREALLAAYEDTPYVPEHHTSENVIILGYVSNILERDREDAKTGLQIYLLEQPLSFAVPVPGVGEVSVGGIVDRMDIYGAPGQERLRIIDYKSGSYTDTTHAKKMSSSWEELMQSEEKSYVRQTLIYSHAVKEHDQTGLPIEPHLFFCRRKLTDITTTVAVGDEPVNDYQRIKAMFYEALQTKLGEIYTTTEFAQCEEDKCPSFCPFFALCGRKPKEF